MTPMRQASALITYNGEDITVSLQDKTGGFSYSDPESGSSDDISLSVNDPNDKWITTMFPSLGDSISAKIMVNDWAHKGDKRSLNCGEFTIDDPGFSGPPTKVSFKAVSKPADSGFTETKRTQTWENVTVQNMATEVASRAGITVQYTAEEINIKSLEQSNQADSEFIKKVCEDYGLSLKVYSNRLVIFDRETYKSKSAVSTIDKGDMISWSFKTTLAGTYTGGTMKYTDPTSEEDIEATVGDKKRLLSVNGKADSQADAEKKIKSAVNKANDEQTTLSIKIPGNPDMVSTQCVMITGLGVGNGKYYITKATHSIGSKYETALELNKIVQSI